MKTTGRIRGDDVEMFKNKLDFFGPEGVLFQKEMPYVKTASRSWNLYGGQTAALELVLIWQTHMCILLSGEVLVTDRTDQTVDEKNALQQYLGWVKGVTGNRKKSYTQQQDDEKIQYKNASDPYINLPDFKHFKLDSDVCSKLVTEVAAFLQNRGGLDIEIQGVVDDDIPQVFQSQVCESESDGESDGDIELPFKRHKS